jgi:catechol 2,3-dioxygenase-like lactoylglutathione lyase family enzyme
MKKRAKKKAPANRAAAKRAPAPKAANRPAAKVSNSSANSGKLTFNHAMIYVKDVERGLDFYRDLLGFKLIEDFRHEGKSVYARLRAPVGDSTIALHHAGPEVSIAGEGVRLYFEVRELDDFCSKLQKKGFYLSQPPRMMPWDWRHAYLNDPDGHEISLYWAGENRFKKTMMKAIEKAAGRKPNRG